MRGERITQALATAMPVSKGLCVFSHGTAERHGQGAYAGSARAMYEWALATGLDPVWLHGSEGPGAAKGRHSAFWSLDGVAKAMRAHVSVGGNNNGVPWPVMSERTWVVQTWHGTPLKRLGRAWPGESERDLRIRERGDFFVSSGPEYTKRFRQCYDVPASAFWETGNPRNDQLVQATSAGRASLREQLAAQYGHRPDQPLILFAPTWREWLSEPDPFPFPEQDIAHFESCIQELEAVFVLRQHNIDQLTANARLMPKGIVLATKDPVGWGVNEWLIASDVLITDYSSIYFDFLVLDRPVIHLVHDIERYSQERGFMVGPERDFAGPAVGSLKELADAMDEAIRRPSALASLRKDLNRIHNPFEDGGATERVGARILELTRRARG